MPGLLRPPSQRAVTQAPVQAISSSTGFQTCFLCSTLLPVMRSTQRTFQPSAFTSRMITSLGSFYMQGPGFPFCGSYEWAPNGQLNGPPALPCAVSRCSTTSCCVGRYYSSSACCVKESIATASARSCAPRPACNRSAFSLGETLGQDEDGHLGSSSIPVLPENFQGMRISHEGHFKSRPLPSPRQQSYSAWHR